MVHRYAKTKKDWFNSVSWIDRPGADIDAYLSTIPPDKMPSYDLREKLEEWKEHGVVIFKNVIDVKLVGKVLDDLDFVLKNHVNYNLTVNEKYDPSNKTIDRLDEEVIEKKTFRLVDLYRNSYNTALLSMVPEAIDFMSHIFLEKPALLQSLTFHRGTEQGIHQDFSFVYEVQSELAKLVACWIPLEDIDKDSGPLQYYCGSHQPGEVGFFDWGGGYINRFDLEGPTSQITEYNTYLERRMAEMDIKPRVYLPSKGDVLIWHGGLVHGGTKINNTQLTRKSHVCHYTSISSHAELSGNYLNNGYVFGLPRRKNISDYIQPARNYNQVPSGLFSRAKNKLRRMVTGK